jgi:Flp pilus assembly protein TadG
VNASTGHCQHDAAAHRPGPLRGFRRDQRGATAIEFAIVALPFFTLMFAIIETAIVFFASQALETATADAARLIMTGQAQQQKFSKTQFQQQICDNMRGLLDCDALTVDVRTYTVFAGSAARPDADEEPQYTPGIGGDIVVVRASYEWPLVTSLVGLSLADRPNGKRLIAATAAFRNEPFEL